MVWNIIIPIVGRYATIITLPVAIILGSLGYVIERRIRGIPYTPVPHEKTIIDERVERQNQQQITASPYKMDTVVPKTIFERNNPDDLKKFR
ncbi:unnamed protein product [Rotaria sordida]|uniref:Uncharacterized protein n=1 Tax=Rotaria sordida TaxID=392033 RepID=A0A814AYX8_9BILA|nr:unnamed protein product [Rotaria sordida]CAF0921489.1 unnamed protein product [Rotaria sordida]CAF1171483.1 unnamed protein product [Rotaria sordida]CAF3864234.1 unnamed protein product [Rotaria sordida]